MGVRRRSFFGKVVSVIDKPTRKPQFLNRVSGKFSVTVFAVRRGRRHVERRVAVEEADRLEREADVATGITGQSSGRGMWWLPNVYQTTTSVSSIGRSAARPLGQAVAARVLVRVVAGRVPLVGRDTASPTGAWSTNPARCGQRRVRRGERHRVLARAPACRPTGSPTRVARRSG